MKTKTILLVDDSASMLILEREILGAEPYDLVVARNGRKALDQADAERPDLILLDVVMPKLDGFETCKRLRQDPATREIPIIMVTTRGEGENVEKGYEAGCNDYVTKPIDKAELLAKVSDLLGARVAVRGATSSAVSA